MKKSLTKTQRKQRFEIAKATIIAAAMSATPNRENTYVTMRTVADFTGRKVNARGGLGGIYGKFYRSKAVTLKDNKTKGDNGLGMMMISRKIPVSQVAAYVRTKGKHVNLGKHVKSPKVQQEIKSVLAFIEANA